VVHGQDHQRPSERLREADIGAAQQRAYAVGVEPEGVGGDVAHGRRALALHLEALDEVSDLRRCKARQPLMLAPRRQALEEVPEGLALALGESGFARLAGARGGLVRADIPDREGRRRLRRRRRRRSRGERKNEQENEQKAVSNAHHEWPRFHH
jgi:hypothetical protein